MYHPINFIEDVYSKHETWKQIEMDMLITGINVGYILKVQTETQIIPRIHQQANKHFPWKSYFMLQMWPYYCIFIATEKLTIAIRTIHTL